MISVRCCSIVVVFRELVKGMKILRERIKSFGHAWTGLVFLVKSEPHARFHLLATVLVILAAWALDVSLQDWRWLILAIALVWVSEAINTAFEYLCDVVSPEFSEAVKHAKDIAAGAVLIAAIAAAFIGISVFGTHICALF